MMNRLLLSLRLQTLRQKVFVYLGLLGAIGGLLLAWMWSGSLEGRLGSTASLSILEQLGLVFGVMAWVASAAWGVHRLVLRPIGLLKDFTGSALLHEGAEGALVARSDEFGEVARAVVGALKETSESNEQLRTLAMTDSLTGLGNRNHFKNRLSQALESGDENSHRVALVVLNLDNFKGINDMLGHEMGDELLRLVGQELKANSRKTDTVARLSADEFALIVDPVERVETVVALAQRILEALSCPRTIGRTEIHPGVSIGITVFPHDGRDAETLMKNADLALYRAKAEGRGNIQLFRHELQLRAIERNAIERDLRIALQKEQFELYYQPKVDMKTGMVRGAEALLRWNHPERGLVPPDMFIPIAEQNGLIVEISRWVIREACQQNRTWQDEGLPKISVAVNVSALDLRRRDLSDLIANTLIQSRLSPQFLEIEVTESMVMHDVEAVIGTLRRLRSLGVGIGIDDFGTGYSSLAYLKRFPVKCLKIDRSFIRDMTSDLDGQAIPRLVIDLARSLGVKVVAEGVETRLHLDLLRAMGCDEAQGYYFGRPMPADEFAVFLVRAKGGLIPDVKPSPLLENDDPILLEKPSVA